MLRWRRLFGDSEESRAMESTTPVDKRAPSTSNDRAEELAMTRIAAKVRARRKEGVARHEDHGLFGPDSVAWRVWGYPTSLTVGFPRAVVVEELDPFLLAS